MWNLFGGMSYLCHRYKFFWPQAITQAFRYSIDSRDEGFIERKEKVDKSHGIWHCHLQEHVQLHAQKGLILL